MDDFQLIEIVKHILPDPANGSIPDVDIVWENAELEHLAADGSNRQFCRIRQGVFNCIIAYPGVVEEKTLKEAEASFKIGCHLRNAGVSVPTLFGHDGTSGIVIYEDLGQTHLYDLVIGCDRASTEGIKQTRATYQQVLDTLVNMQIEGAKGFRKEWCWDTPQYDKDVMLQRESGYFYNQCWLGFLGMNPVQGIEEDFIKLAETAGRSDTMYFLHRDFQSRNIMIKDDQIRIIDYQGGRRGPLGYDVASLLIDPYTSLPDWLQDELMEYYVKRVKAYLDIDGAEFISSYHALSLQRNLQIAGAFSFLGKVCNKRFFLAYIRPALERLAKQLSRDDVVDLPVLRQTARQALEVLPQAL